MATKLKNLHLTSVDLVRSGANQEADICLFKSAAPTEATESPAEAEPGTLRKFINWLLDKPTAAENEPTAPIENETNTEPQTCEKALHYTEALALSFQSIEADESLSPMQKGEMMAKSLQQFFGAVEEVISPSVAPEAEVEKAEPEYEVIHEINKGNVDRIVEKWNPWHGADGRFTSGPGGAVGGVSSRTISGGGISIHVKNGKEPKSGYMCATYAERAEWIKGDDVKDPEKRTAAIKSFMEKNKDVLSDPDNYLGTWYDTESGNISLDISRNFKSKSAAIKYATEHNEKAIWDVKNMAEISTGGTGNNL